MSESQRDLGIKAFRAGNRTLAFQYLTKAIKENSQDELAWLWLAACVDSDDKKRFCLQKVLEINPSNPSAKRVLSEMEKERQPAQQAPLMLKEAQRNDKTTEYVSDTNQVDDHFSVTFQKSLSETSPKQKQLKKEFRKYTVFLVRLSIFFILATLGISYFLQPGIFITRSIVTTMPEWLNQAPSSDEISRLNELADNFENPLRQTYIEINSAEGIQVSEQKSISLTGKLTGGFQINPIEDSGAPVYGLKVDIDNTSLLVLHRGYIGSLSPGDKIKIDGVYLPKAQGISAHKVIRVGLSKGFPNTQNLELTRWAVLDVIWSIFSLTFYLWASVTQNWRKAYKKLAIPAIAALIFLNLSACTVDFTTIVSSNGQGHITVTARETKENMDFMRQVPGMNGYLDALARQLQAEGLQLTQWEESSDEVLFLQRPFDNLIELGAAKDAGLDGSWVAVQEYEEDGWKVIRYFALVDTTTLFRDTPGIDQQVNNEVQNQMSKIDMTYSLVLPGQISYHNGSFKNGTKVTWKIGMNQKNRVIGEARIPVASHLGDNQKKFIQLGLWAVFFTFDLVFIRSLLKLRTK